MRRLLLISVLAAAGCRTGVAPAAPPPPAPAQAREPAGEPPPRHDFKFIGYDPSARSLSVQFNDGSRTNYAGVPESVYVEFMRTSGKLGYFTNRIQGRFPARQIE